MGPLEFVLVIAAVLLVLSLLFGGSRVPSGAVPFGWLIVVLLVLGFFVALAT